MDLGRSHAAVLDRFFGHRWAVADMPYPLVVQGENNTGTEEVDIRECLRSADETVGCMTVRAIIHRRRRRRRRRPPSLDHEFLPSGGPLHAQLRVTQRVRLRRAWPVPG